MPDQIADPALLKLLVDADLKANPPTPPEAKGGGLSKSSLAMLLGGNAADAASTLYALKNGAKETNPVLGSHPSAAKLLALKGAGVGVQALLLKLLAKEHPKAANVIAKVTGGAMGGLAAHNVMQVKK